MSLPSGPGETKQSSCNLPRDPGPCRRYETRWFHDSSSNTCAQFTYGGCGGNSNNFESREQCERTCGGEHLGELDLSLEPFPLSNNSILSATIQDRRPTVEATGTSSGASECNLPQKRGNCRSFTPRWSYDAGSGQCVRFVYSGCGGNANNFESQEECNQRCRGMCVGRLYWGSNTVTPFFTNITL